MTWLPDELCDEYDCQHISQYVLNSSDSQYSLTIVVVETRQNIALECRHKAGNISITELV